MTTSDSNSTKRTWAQWIGYATLFVFVAFLIAMAVWMIPPADIDSGDAVADIQTQVESSSDTVLPAPADAGTLPEMVEGEFVFETVTIPASEPLPPMAKVLINTTLWGMAERLCGSGTRWTEIAALNPGLDPHKLLINQQLVLPDDCQSDQRSVPMRSLKVTHKLAIVDDAPVTVPVPAAKPLLSAPHTSEPAKADEDVLHVSVPCDFAALETNRLMLTTASYQRWLVECSKDNSIDPLQLKMAKYYRQRLQELVREWSFTIGTVKMAREMRQQARLLKPEQMEGLSAFAASQRLNEAARLWHTYTAEALSAAHQQAVEESRLVKIFTYMRSKPASGPPEDATVGDE